MLTQFGNVFLPAYHDPDTKERESPFVYGKIKYPDHLL